jgi:hypothetical protein
MIRFYFRGFSKALSALVVLVMLTGTAYARQDPEPTYPPDGTWLAIGTAVISGVSVKIPFMDTYVSLLNQHGLKGTVICTMNWRNPFPVPLGQDGTPISVTALPTGQGAWRRVEKNVYTFTAWRILLGPTGNAVGWAQFSGSIRPDAPDHFLGEINIAFYTLDFVALVTPPMSAATEAWRVAVEGQ